MLESVIAKLEQAVSLLKEADAEIEAQRASARDEAAPALAAVPEPSPVDVETDDVEHQAFKCPGCGAEYDAPVICGNQHPGEQTLPTDQVLAGAAPGGAAAEPAAAAEPVEPEPEKPAESQQSTAKTPVPPTTPAWPT